MHHIVFLDRIAFKGVLPRPSFAHQWTEYAQSTSGEAAERLHDATIAITNSVRLSEPELQKSPHLQLIAVAATGVDNIDLDACHQRQITVTNVRDWCTASVPEHIFALILALRRQILSSSQHVQDGSWRASGKRLLVPDPLPHDLYGSTLGIIGYGTLAKRVELLSRAFNMNVLVAERKDTRECRPGRTSFGIVLRQSDVLVLLCPLTPPTYHLLGQAEFRVMKPSALVINSGRGGLIDEVALADAVRQGQIAGAGLDVLEQEPPPLEHPLIGQSIPNIIVTPHIAWASAESMQNILAQLIQTIEAFVRGEPRNVVSQQNLPWV